MVKKIKPTSKKITRLIALAKEAADQAYAPYSQFAVGCALELSDKKVITSFNIENAVLGNTVCAERVALFISKTQGYKKEANQTIVIFANSKEVISPCGTCRQVIWELASEKVKIIMVNNQQMRTATIFTLLPFGFNKSFL